MRVPALPAPEQLRIRRLGPPEHISPLGQTGTLFLEDDYRVLVASDTREVTLREDGGQIGFEPAGPRERIFFDPSGTRCGIVTCGGLCPGINDVIRSIVLTLWHQYGIRHILGFRNGYSGLIEHNGEVPMALTPAAVHNIHETGGTMLGTSRGPQETGDMVDTLVRRRICILFAIGGNGTLKGASALADEIARRGVAISVIGIPKTIDNDLIWIEHSFGFTTAVNEATRSIVAAHTEAHDAQNGIGLVKLMGRLSGFIAAYATLAEASVNYCLIPEVPFSLKGPTGLLQSLEQRLENRHHAVIVIAEGAAQDLLRQGRPEYDASGNLQLGDVGAFLRERILEHFHRRGVNTSIKYIDPSYLIRSLPANSYDSALCLALGQNAVHAGMAGRTDMLVGTWNNRFTHVPLPLATQRRRQIDPQGQVWQRVLAATGQPRSML